MLKKVKNLKKSYMIKCQEIRVNGFDNAADKPCSCHPSSYIGEFDRFGVKHDCDDSGDDGKNREPSGPEKHKGHDSAYHGHDGCVILLGRGGGHILIHNDIPFFV
jgi:hypothetical protein